jgi:hypothetical protein
MHIELFFLKKIKDEGCYSNIPYCTAPIAIIGTTDNRTPVNEGFNENIRTSEPIICSKLRTSIEMFTVTAF